MNLLTGNLLLTAAVAFTLDVASAESGARAVRDKPASNAGVPMSSPLARKKDGDWITGCTAAGPSQICDAVQSLVDSTTGAERIRVGVALHKASGAYGIQVKTPLGLRLDSGAMLRLSEVGDDAITEIKFNRCLAEGCYAERPLTTAEMTRLKAAKKVELIVLDLNSQPVVIPLSTQGMQIALNTL